MAEYRHCPGVEKLEVLRQSLVGGGRQALPGPPHCVATIQRLLRVFWLHLGCTLFVGRSDWGPARGLRWQPSCRVATTFNPLEATPRPASTLGFLPLLVPVACNLKSCGSLAQSRILSFKQVVAFTWCRHHMACLYTESPYTPSFGLLPINAAGKFYDILAGQSLVTAPQTCLLPIS